MSLKCFNFVYFNDFELFPNARQRSKYGAFGILKH